ncbi:arf-GAP domain and FG repeat-containing protein 2 isoform X3 [Serinus canaria]|uniref:arf-GAP domain and FG repeat-containing protein 2 isoform X3 n=1 Tax=Serinus canaria TaxID=9135 RepID=UPI0021CC6A48|nr:arf-GAP domain and FG repeat-containing protein 2 isoform X3 [Serinus canaria]
MAAGSGGGTGPGAGPGGGPGARRGSAGRDAEAEVWCRRVRELVSSVPANRLCFECGQRGVTYVDISVGSLVCTGCSGALRGLNPPHRVKSISMTTFSEAEVLFLQAHGNEACRRVWLGTFDPRTSLLPDSHDPQKVKEFLQEKYEKKRCLAQLPEKPAPTSWLTSGGTPSPAQPPPPPSLPSLAVFGGSRNFGNPPWLLSCTCRRCGCPGRGHPRSAHRGRSFCQPLRDPPRPPSAAPRRIHQPLHGPRGPQTLHQPLREQRPRCCFHLTPCSWGLPQPLPGRWVAFLWVQRCQSFHQPLRDRPGPGGAVRDQAPGHQPLPMTAAASGDPGRAPPLRRDQVLFFVPRDLSRYLIYIR